ncbi:MAG: hypothetical protein Q9161_007117 [Pseudevernia consocians]
MTSLNTKARANFDKWLADIDHNDLRVFVFANTTVMVDFGSDDFKLVHCGRSDGDPVDCHIIEARINNNTKDKQLKKLLLTTGSLAKDRTRLAFALVPAAMTGYCPGDYVRRALQESPVPGKPVVNKVHVRWSPSVKWDGDAPFYKVGFAPFLFEKIPFAGYRLDGTAAPKKKERGKK